MKSYRFTKQKSVLSDWGHAMFSDNADQVYHYGKIAYSVDHKDLTPFEEVAPLIESAIKEEIESGEAYNVFEEYEINDINAFINSFNSENIVVAAEVYDNSIWCMWLTEKILEQNNIWAIKTNDGAIVWDEEIIKRNKEMEKEYYGE